MKYIIASDLHGSAYYCKKLLERMEAEQAHRTILLGDLLYHGPRNPLPRDYDTKAVTAMLNSVKEQLLCVQGNCDSAVDQMVLEFPMLADYAVLPVGENLCYLTHGHNYGPDNLPPLMAGDILISGHTHVPGVWQKDHAVCMNPGSLSLPKENSPHSYMVLEGERFCWKDVETGEEYMPA